MHKVYIACGHGTQLDGSWDPGCVFGNYTEAGLMLPITRAAVKHLRASGVTVYTDADDSNKKNMKATVAEANRQNVELYVSIHCDYSGAPSGEWAAVDFGEPIEDNFIVLDGRGFLIRTAHADQVFSISGDAEAVSMADMNWVAVYGDCSNSVTGTK